MLSLSSGNLAMLANKVYTNIFRYLSDETRDFVDAKNFSETLNYALKNRQSSFGGFPYMAVWKAIRKSTDYRRVQTQEGFSLELSLLKAELDSLENLDLNVVGNHERVFAIAEVMRDIYDELHKEYRFNRTNGKTGRERVA